MNIELWEFTYTYSAEDKLSIIWDGTGLSSTCRECGSPHHLITPSEADWQEYLNLMEAIKVSRWGECRDDHFGMKRPSWQLSHSINGKEQKVYSDNFSAQLYGQDLSESALNAVVILTKGKFTFKNGAQR